MKILFFGLNYAPEIIGTGKYNGEWTQWLASKGLDVKVITALPYYPGWRVFPGFRAWSYHKKVEHGVLVYRCPLYVPSRITTIRRIAHLGSFALSSLPVLFSQYRWKPNLVILVVPTLFCALQALIFARISGAKVMIHIQDFEVDAVFGLGMVKQRGLLRRLVEGVERWTLCRFDWVSTISQGMLDKAKAKGVSESRLRFLPNWSEVERFRGAQRDPLLLKRLGLDPTKQVVLYSGNLGEKQGLGLIVAAAERYRSRNDKTFLIIGDGAEKGHLLDLVKQRGLENVIFAPLQPYEHLPALLASADCHLVIQRRGAADAVMPSKLTNILAVGGHAVITADPESSLGRLCEDFPGIGVLVEPESVDALISGIDQALALSLPNQVAMDYATEYLASDKIMRRFISEFLPSTP